MGSRRHFLGTLAGSFSGLALSNLLARDGILSGTLHHLPRAKRVVQLFMAGAASHVDLFDHKPLLESKHGQPWDPGETVELFQSTPGACFASPWTFRRYGESGKAISDIVVLPDHRGLGPWSLVLGPWSLVTQRRPPTPLP